MSAHSSDVVFVALLKRSLFFGLFTIIVTLCTVFTSDFLNKENKSINVTAVPACFFVSQLMSLMKKQTLIRCVGEHAAQNRRIQ